jgi:hypothetical protein
MSRVEGRESRVWGSEGLATLDSGPWTLDPRPSTLDSRLSTLTRTPAPPLPTPPTVPAILPLSLLEAIRNLDTPVEDGLEELAEEIVVRRLGLSPTVAAQIQRYRQAAEREGRVYLDEAVSVLRLVGRRPDAPLVFADGGRRAARYAARGGGCRPMPWPGGWRSARRRASPGECSTASCDPGRRGARCG